MRRIEPDAIFLTVCITVVVGLLILVGWIVYRDETSEKIELTKSDWNCTKRDIVTHLQSHWVGKSVILIPVTDSQCVTYERANK